MENRFKDFKAVCITQQFYVFLSFLNLRFYHREVEGTLISLIKFPAMGGINRGSAIIWLMAKYFTKKPESKSTYFILSRNSVMRGSENSFEIIALL